MVDMDKDDDDDAGSEYSMDMINDPRFTTPNVLDKRLYAFTAQVAFVGGLTTTASLGQCFKLRKHLAFGYCTPTPWFKVGQSLLQLLSFFGMSFTLCLSLYSTLVSVNQSYFGNRLMTAGTNGFELARSFYMDPRMVQMRHRSVKYLARALILLLLSSGGMLYVKFSEDQDVEAGYETNDDQARPIYYNVSWVAADSYSPICDSHVHPAGILVIIVFVGMAFYLYKYIQLPHEALFKRIYRMRYQQGDAFGRLLESEAQRDREMVEETGTKSSPRDLKRFPPAGGCNCM